MNGLTVSNTGVVGAAGSDWSIVPNPALNAPGAAPGSGGSFGFGDITSSAAGISGTMTTAAVGSSDNQGAGSFILPPGGSPAPVADPTKLLGGSFG